MKRKKKPSQQLGPLVPEFRHKEKQLRCPKCGYIFSNGFTQLPNERVPGGLSARSGPFDKSTEAVTLCSRCKSVLALRDVGALRLVTEADEMLMDEGTRKAVAFLRDLTKEAFGDQS